MDNVDIIIGSNTDIIAAEGKIVTAGGIDTHVHFINPEQAEVALRAVLLHILVVVLVHLKVLKQLL